MFSLNKFKVVYFFLLLFNDVSNLSNLCILFENTLYLITYENFC